MSKDPKPNKNNDKKKFNSEAFKYAIGMLESSGGKHLTNPNSSASGKYHFLWRYIKNDPLLKGKSQREFIANPELQEKVMDNAINGKLAGFPNYSTYSRALKARYNSDLPQESIAALTHFLGKSGVDSFLKNKGYNVPGKTNLTAEDYAKKFSGYMEDYSKQNTNPSNIPSDEYVGVRGDSPEFIRNLAFEASKKQVDNTRVNGNFNSPQGLVTPNNMPNDQSDPRAGFSPPQGLQTPNNFKYGGKSDDDMYVNGGELDRFENGGTHEENPLGGIPQGIGANGKPNLVEEGETKWNDYIFSNSIGLDGTFTRSDGKSMNVFKEGGKLTGPGEGKEYEATEAPSIGPKAEEIPTDNSLDVTKYGHLSKAKHVPRETMHVPDVRQGYIQNVFGLENPEQVDFISAVRDAPAEAFLARYNDPITRQRMMEQGNVTPEQIDNMILKGLTTAKEVGGNTRGSKASYVNDVIRMGEGFKDNVPVETHERVHASGIDAVMSDKLTSILGNAFHQKDKTFLKKNSPGTLEYLNRPHEAYGNFAEFRGSLGLKPGEQIDIDKLRKLVKEKGLGMDNFYRAYDNDKIIEALNTVAYQEDNKNNFDNYRLS